MEKRINVGSLIRTWGLEKNPKLINVGPTFISDYRVVIITFMSKVQFITFVVIKSLSNNIIKWDISASVNIVFELFANHSITNFK